IGGGYIGLEIAGVFAGLGSEVFQVVRGSAPLRGFDPLLVEAAQEGLAEAGARLIAHASPASLAREDKGLTLALAQGAPLADLDCVSWATGRRPATECIDASVGIRLDSGGHVAVDEYQETNVPGVFAIGDVTGRALLTPV